MVDFVSFSQKLGEHGLQAILENWEHFQGIRHETPVSLEQRWEVFMRESEPQQPRSAA